MARIVLAGVTDAVGYGDDALIVKIGGNSNAAQLPFLRIVTLVIVVLVVALAIVIYSVKRRKGQVKT